MATERESREMDRDIVDGGVIVVGIFGLALLAVFFLILLGYTGLVSWQKAPTLQVMVVGFTMGLSVFLSATWFMAVTDVIRMEVEAKRMIGKVLIASVIGTMATAVAFAFKSEQQHSQPNPEMSSPSPAQPAPQK